MPKRMLIDASHPEETRVVVTDGTRLDEFDVETSTKKQLKGNIYLAKVVRVEPSLQAAFVEYGGNRHGFLAFGEIHPDYYQIPVADRQRLIAQQAEEARAAQAEEEAEDEADDSPAPAPEPVAEGAPEEHAEPPAAEFTEAPVETLPAIGPTPTEAIEPLPAADPPAEEPPPASTPRAQPLAIPVETISAPAESGSAEPAHADEAGPTAATPDIIEIAPDPAPPPEQINAEAAEPVEDDQPPRRIPPKFLRNYKIQEVIKRRQILLVQVVKEERGNKGAALTTYLSLAGRYCVLMPNSPRGGGISRKITSAADRRRLREITEEMQIPDGMGLIVRTAGAQRPKTEIKRDCEYLLRLWDSIRETTLASSAPALIYEEASLIKRSIRDVYTRDVEEVIVEGEEAYRQAKDFMRMLMPSHARKVQPYRDLGMPLFVREKIESQLDAMHSPTVQLKSGGYIVINQTEALVAIDVNSGRSTRERGIEETALRTNLEAADEIARQLRLRDLAGLIVIDFIDMESARHNGAVERRLKDALRHDRARIQVGRISHFGLMEMSRQRLRPSLTEQAFVTCPHCAGTGLVRTTESAAMQVLRAIEEEGAKRRAAEIAVTCHTALALYLLNHKRDRLAGIEAQAGMRVVFASDDALNPPAHRIERTKAAVPSDQLPGTAPAPAPMPEADADEDDVAEEPDVVAEESEAQDDRPAWTDDANGDEESRRRRRRRRRGRRENGQAPAASATGDAPDDAPVEGEPDDEPEAEPGEAAEADTPAAADGGEPGDDAEQRRRRRGRRGGRRRRRDEFAPGEKEGQALAQPAELAASDAVSPAMIEPAPTRWAGPTPADPFASGAGYDVYAAMEAAEEAAAREAEARASGRAAEPTAESTAEPTPVVEAPAIPVPVSVEPAASKPPEPPPAPAIQPILVDQAPADAPRRQGWWKR
jgi:ribonuclease E